MSIKSTVFTGMLGNPLNIFNFVCVIPSLSDVQMYVASTTFPSEELQEFVLHFQGERVKFPSIPTNSGVWSATMPEGELQKVYKAYRSYMSQKYNQETGQLIYWAITDKHDISIWPRRLKGDVNGSDKVFGVTLKGCFLKGRGDVSLSNSDATTTWMWNMTYSYDWIKELDATEVTGA